MWNIYQNTVIQEQPQKVRYTCFFNLLSRPTTEDGKRIFNLKKYPGTQFKEH